MAAHDAPSPADEASSAAPAAAKEKKEPPKTVAMPPGGLPPGWAEQRLPDGRIYYWHARTRETSWVRPGGGDGSAWLGCGNVTGTGPWVRAQRGREDKKKRCEFALLVWYYYWQQRRECAL